MTIYEIKCCKESEHKVEFKEAASQYNYNNGRKSVLGYVVALANEGGGKLIFGVKENKSGLHAVTGSSAWENQEGKLVEDIYRDKQIRVFTEVLFEEHKRVLIIHIPSRPVGKLFKLDDVPLMRVGEDLLPMSDEQLFKILQEQEPDFSAKICDGLSIQDLDQEAIVKLKQAYARKQENQTFLTLSHEQALSDLNLLINKKVTYAALILLGKSEVIENNLPQSIVRLEYRNTLTQINFDNRINYSEPYFIAVEKLWEAINQRNGKVPVQSGAFIFDIPFFNKEVIREALNNAVAHRDYRRTSEVVIKLFPTEMHIISPGGFPLGVTIHNLLTVNSTPRNRLMTDVMAKTGIVERAGQGVDKIFYQTISEAKPEPDYSHSDNFQVELRLSAIVEDKAFALFIRGIQEQRQDDQKLSVQDVITLNQIRKGSDKAKLNASTITRLEKEGLIERIGRTNSQKLILSKQYYLITGNQAQYSKEKPLETIQINMLITQHLDEFKEAKMKDFVSLLSKFMTREQVKYQVDLMVITKMLDRKGKGSGTFYTKGIRMEEGARLAKRAVELGIEEMKRLGEIKSNPF